MEKYETKNVLDTIPQSKYQTQEANIGLRKKINHIRCSFVFFLIFIQYVFIPFFYFNLFCQEIVKILIKQSCFGWVIGLRLYKLAVWLNNRVTNGLVFLIFDWLKNCCCQMNDRNLNPVVIWFLNQNAPIIYCQV